MKLATNTRPLLVVHVQSIKHIYLAKRMTWIDVREVGQTCRLLDLALHEIPLNIVAQASKPN